MKIKIHDTDEAQALMERYAITREAAIALRGKEFPNSNVTPNSESTITTNIYGNELGGWHVPIGAFEIMEDAK